MNLQILKTNKEFKDWKRKQLSEVIFVPTMGSLHIGHEKLIEVAKEIGNEKSSAILVSIFVNPLQFRAGEDFEKYPRALDNDCKIAEQAGANAIWAPRLEDVFPGGVESHFKLEAPSQLKLNLCGLTRKGHFDGVVTVVSRLINIVQPNFLILGEKDWQQLIIIKKLIQDLNINIKIINVPTVRDSDGLPISSRNKYLSISEREKATFLPKTLENIAENYKKTGKINLKEIKYSLKQHDLTVEYLQVVDTETLQLIDNPKHLSLLGAAIKIGQTRLIDHTFLMTRSPIVAIDGPAGAGKSTVTKKFAKRMGLMYLDTGAMYRAVTWFILKNKISTDEINNIKEVLKDINLELNVSNSGDQKVIVNDEDITNQIRSPNVTSSVSKIAALHCVRESLTSQQRKFGLKGGLVAEGRDIGTTIFPDAELKVFLTATIKERAKRRALDLKLKGFDVPELLILEKEISHRDELDSSREISPLIKSSDAKELITDGMTIEEVVENLAELFRLKVPKEVWPIYS